MATVKKKKRRSVSAPVVYKENKSVNIKVADNGFTVRSYGPKGEETFVAKSEAEALRHARTLLGKK
jgi:hypothetical protein